MKHLKLVLLISAVMAFAAACANNAGTRSPTNNASASNAAASATNVANADEFAARATYGAACARCHRENGEGGVADLGEGATLKVPSFKSGHGLNHTDAQFARQIAKGGDGMPAFEKRLSPEQINGLVRFIRQEFQAGLINEGATSPSH